MATSENPPPAPGSRGLAWLALLTALAGVGLAIGNARRAPGGHEGEGDADLLRPGALEGRVADLEGRLESIQDRIAALEERATKAEKATEEAAGIARSANRLATEVAGATGTGSGETVRRAEEEARRAADEAKKAEGERILAMIRAGDLPPGSVFEVMQRARDIGFLDQALAELEKYAEAHPDDADVQVDLGGAYIVKLMAVPEGMERGAWSMKSLAACEAALKIQPEHWDAQFLKGMNLSQWPAFLGKQPEAIKTFERLIEQQERGAPDPKFTKVYYQLGNTYRAAGNLEKARKVFARGLELYPEDRQLKEQVEMLDRK